MSCRFCLDGGKVANPLLIYPQSIDDSQQGCFICQLCAIERGLYCLAHQLAHTGYGEKSICCRVCAEEIVQRLLPRAESYYQRLTNDLPAEEVKRYADWLEEVCNDLPEEPEERVLRNLVCWALTRRLTVVEAIETVIRQADARSVML